MGSKSALILLVLVVAAMLVGTKLYTDARFQASQDALEIEASSCGILRQRGGSISASDQERCASLWRRNGERNAGDETIAMVLLGVTALVALTGVVLILRRRRRTPAGLGNEQP